MGRPGPLIAACIDLPEKLLDFDPSPFLSSRSLDALLSPDNLLMPDADLPPPIGRGRLADRKELLSLGKRWDTIGRCKLVKVSEVDERDVGDVFPVPKSGAPFPADGVDRQIIDRRRRNAREVRVISGSRWMPNAASICEVHIPYHCSLRVSADDLRNFYHSVPGSDERARSTPVGFPYPVSCFKDWSSWRDDFVDGDWAYISWAGLGMGDHNAVDLAEEMHFNILTDAELLQPQHLMVYPSSLPVNDDGYYEGVMIDDRIGLQLHEDLGWQKEIAEHAVGTLGDFDATPSADRSYLPEGYPRFADAEGGRHRDEVAFERSNAAYVACGLERHPGKEKRGVECATFWGLELEGKHGLAGPPRHKLAALLVLLRAVERHRGLPRRQGVARNRHQDVERVFLTSIALGGRRSQTLRSSETLLRRCKRTTRKHVRHIRI